MQDVGSKSIDFNHKSGLYHMELIVGDALLSNSFKWHIADINLKFSQEAISAGICSVNYFSVRIYLHSKP